MPARKLSGIWMAVCCVLAARSGLARGPWFTCDLRRARRPVAAKQRERRRDENPKSDTLARAEMATEVMNGNLKFLVPELT